MPAAVPLPTTAWVVGELPPLKKLHCKLPGEKRTYLPAATEKDLSGASVANVSWLPYAVPAALVA